MVLCDMGNDKYMCSTVDTEEMNVAFKLEFNQEKGWDSRSSSGINLPKQEAPKSLICSPG